MTAKKSMLQMPKSNEQLQAEATQRNVRNVLRSSGKLLPAYWVVREGKLVKAVR